MATTTTIKSTKYVTNRAYPGELTLVEVAVHVSGTYDSAARPNFNLLSALQESHQGVTAVAALVYVPMRDSIVSSTRRTVDYATLSMSTVNAGSTNDKLTFRIHSGSNGTGTGEIADTTAVDRTFTFIASAVITDGTS